MLFKLSYDHRHSDCGWKGYGRFLSHDFTRLDKNFNKCLINCHCLCDCSSEQVSPQYERNMESQYNWNSATRLSGVAKVSKNTLTDCCKGLQVFCVVKTRISTICISNTAMYYICQGCRRFETSVFFSVKINISTTGGFRVGFFQPDTNHP